MADKLSVLALFTTILGSTYALCMRSTPRRGWLKVVERVCAGIILCYLCGLVLRPLGITLPQSPVSALSAGYLGLPGVAFGAALSLWR